MIVISIVGIASSIVITQYSNKRDSKALFLGAKQVVNDMRMAQNYAFGSLDFGGVNPGYGIRFSTTTNPNSYIIFGDKNSNKAYDAADSEGFQTINLPDNVKVTSLKIGAMNYNDMDVVFTTPYGEVYINGDNKDGGNFIDLEVEIGNPAGAKIINISSSRKIN